MEKLITPLEQETLNKLGSFELTASHVYQSLSNRMKLLSYVGAEKFFLEESLTERTHYNTIATFVNNLGSELSVDSLDKVSFDVTDIKKALTIAFEMEKDLLNEYEKEASNDKLSAKVRFFLQDFVKIQVESVGEYLDLLAMAELTTDMLLLDNQLK